MPFAVQMLDDLPEDNLTTQSQANNHMEILRKSFFFKAEDSLHDGEFSGYAAGISNLDKVGDIIAPGSFTKTIASFLDGGVIAWQHDWSTPIGKPLEAREDEHGLFIKAKISDTSVGRDALTLLRDGVIKKMSIGFRIKDAEFFDSLDELRSHARENGIPIKIDSLEGVFGGVRLIKEIELFEVSLVTVPANDAATVTSVKDFDSLIQGEPHAGLPFAKHSDAVLAAVGEFANRAKQIAELRLKEGRVLSAANRSKLQGVVDAWEGGQEAINSIKELLASTENSDKEKAYHEARRLYAQFLFNQSTQYSTATKE